MGNVEHIKGKYPAIVGLRIEDIQTFLRTADSFQILDLKEAIRVFKCDAHNADQKLRSMADAGYIAVDLGSHAVLKWQRTILGNALAGERKARRITADRVNEIVEAVTARGREINADPDRLHRVKLKLFGSALDEVADDYGDVDISVEFHERVLADDEKERIRADLKSRCKPDNMSFLGKLMMIENQDRKEIKAILKKGFGPLSLMADDPATLGAAYRWLVDHNIEADRPRPAPVSVVRPNTPPPEDSEPQQDLPPETVMKAQFREIADTRKVPIGDLSFHKASQADELEADLWTPVIGRDGTLRPDDLRKDKNASFAGFQHLCPVWKEDIGSLAMLEKSLDWCEDNGVWVNKLWPFVSIDKNHRSNIIRYGFEYPNLLVADVSRDKFDANLFPRERKTVSRLDLAGAYSVACSISNMYREMGCFRMPHFHAKLVVSNPTSIELPDLPRLLKAGELNKGALDGRMTEFGLADMDRRYDDPQPKDEPLFVVRSTTPQSPHYLTGNKDNPTTYDRAEAARVDAFTADVEAGRWTDEARAKGYAYGYFAEEDGVGQSSILDLAGSPRP